MQHTARPRRFGASWMKGQASKSDTKPRIARRRLEAVRETEPDKDGNSQRLLTAAHSGMRFAGRRPRSLASLGSKE